MRRMDTAAADASHPAHADKALRARLDKALHGPAAKKEAAQVAAKAKRKGSV